MDGNSNNYNLGFLFEVITPNNNKFYFQNFQRDDDFLFNGNDYLYVPMIYNPPTRNINLESQNTSIALPNIPTVLAVLVANNFFRDSIGIVTEIQYDFPTVPAINKDLLIVSNYSITENQDNSGVALTLESPFNVLTGKFPNVYYQTGYNETAVNLIGYVPEVPLYSRPSIG